MRVEWSTKARYSALGRDGVIRVARVAEWFQEAAVHASSVAGYPPSRYEAMGASWFVRELDLAIDRPIAYGETVTVETWISDLRRFRSHREYRARVDSGEVVARGRADWLLLTLDRNTRKVRPYLPDDEMRAAFPVVDEVAVDEARSLWVPEDPPVRTVEHTVRASELDWHDHVNHAAYVAWLEDAGVRFRHAKLRYEKDARPGDQLQLDVFRAGDGAIVQVMRDDERILVAAAG